MLLLRQAKKVVHMLCGPPWTLRGIFVTGTISVHHFRLIPQLNRPTGLPFEYTSVRTSTNFFLVCSLNEIWC